MRCAPPPRLRRAISSGGTASGSSRSAASCAGCSPRMGSSQRFRLVESLLETGVEPTYTWRDVNIIPARILPTKALVLALTPLVDPRFVTTVADLRARGYDVSVVEVDPEPLVEPGPTELDRLAHRLWLLQREVLRARLARLGVACARWSDDVELRQRRGGESIPPPGRARTRVATGDRRGGLRRGPLDRGARRGGRPRDRRRRAPRGAGVPVDGRRGRSRLEPARRTSRSASSAPPTRPTSRSTIPAWTRRPRFSAPVSS